jgi:uncharacterized protein
MACKTPHPGHGKPRSAWNKQTCGTWPAKGTAETTNMVERSTLASSWNAEGTPILFKTQRGQISSSTSHHLSDLLKAKSIGAKPNVKAKVAPGQQCHNRFMLTEPVKLTIAEARALGALIEKEATTPDYYPLSLNALINACNQRSNREPVMDLDEDDVRQALHGLEAKQIAGRARSADGRVAKYEHWLGEAFNFSRAETALICVLLLRGPQTPGELRGRTERMHEFAEISDVMAGLQKLLEREPPLVTLLPRQPGSRESRYAHLLSGPVEAAIIAGASSTTVQGEDPSPQRDERIARLETTVAELQRDVAALREKIDSLFG